MNKLLLNQVIEIKENGTFLLEVSNFFESFSIRVFPHVDAKILLLANSFRGKILVNILENANLSLETFGIASSFFYDVHLAGYGAQFHFIYGGLTNLSEKQEMKIYHEASNTNSDVVNHVAHYGKDTTFLQVDGYIPKGCRGCRMVQDNKIMLMKDGKGKILPNLYISEFDSFSEHSAYIAKFSREELFYLKTRGIDEKGAISLLKKSFLLGGFSFLDGEDTEVKDIKSKLIYTIQEFGGDDFASR